MEIVDFNTIPMNVMTTRILTVFAWSFAIVFVTAWLVGFERKAKWFKRREKYTFFNRRGVFGEYMNFGYPRTWQGLAVALAMYGIIFLGGFWYLFIHPYV